MAIRFISRAIGVIVLAGLLLIPVSSRAAYVDFNMDAIHFPTTSISYAGGAAPLIGSNISVDSVVGVVTPLNSGVIRNIIGGILNFTTGNFTGSTANSWSFGPGGNITLMGGVDLNNNGIIDGGDPSGVLLAGSFNAADVYSAPLVGQIRFDVLIAGISDTKNALLTAYYGLPNVAYIGNMNLSFFAIGAPPGALTSTNVLSGDIVNTPIPVPTTMLLLASGVLGLVGLKRKFIK